MDQLVNVLLATDKAHIVLHMALDCGPGLYGLNQIYGTTIALPLLRVSVASIHVYPNKINGVLLQWFIEQCRYDTYEQNEMGEG